MSHVFISYSHQDRGYVERVSLALKEKGISVWFDDRISVGDSWNETIIGAIRDSSAIVVIMSPEALNSKWVQKEILIAQYINKPIFPLLLKGKVFELLIDIQCEDVTGNKLPSDKFYRSLPDTVFSGRDSAIESLSTQKVPRTSEFTQIIIDQSHRQGEWFGSPTANGGYVSSLTSVEHFARTMVNHSKRLSRTNLNGYDILIFPMPFGTIVENSEFEEIVQWVMTGHSLVMLGFYMMETHLYTNFNNLARRFGFEFSHNLVMPIAKDDFRSCMQQAFGLERDLWVVTGLVGSPETHDILNGVNKVALLSSCTMEPVSSTDLRVSTTSEYNIMKAIGFKDNTGRIIQVRDYILDRQSPASFLIATRYGKGKLVGIGTWKVFLNEFVTESSVDNGKLFENVIKWLVV